MGKSKTTKQTGGAKKKAKTPKVVKAAVVRKAISEEDFTMAREVMDKLHDELGHPDVDRLSIEDADALDLKSTAKVFALSFAECEVALAKLFHHGKIDRVEDHFIAQVSAKLKAKDGSRSHFVTYYRSNSGIRVDELSYRLFVSEVELSRAAGRHLHLSKLCGIDKCIQPQHLTLERIGTLQSRATCHSRNDSDEDCEHDPRCIFEPVPKAIIDKVTVKAKKAAKKARTKDASTSTPRLTVTVLAALVRAIDGSAERLLQRGATALLPSEASLAATQNSTLSNVSSKRGSRSKSKDASTSHGSGSKRGSRSKSKDASTSHGSGSKRGNRSKSDSGNSQIIPSSDTLFE